MSEFKRKEQEGGPRLSYINTELIEQGGLFFKDLAHTGELLPYEDWRLPAIERAQDLAARLSADEIAGLMLISGHQMVPAVGYMAMNATYEGKPYGPETNAPWELTDQQKDMVANEHIRNILQASVESPEISVRWNNELQALAEESPFGIPVSIATDPRHGASSSTAEFKSNEAGVSKWPEGIGLAATFDSGLVNNFAKIAAKEYRALGISTALGPQIDLATEPRWMRMEDTLGGDAGRTIEFTKAYCDGMQTTESSAWQSPDPGWGMDSVLTMVKHWPGGGTGEGGRDAHYAFGEFAVYPGENFETHLRPFTEGAFRLDGPTASAAAVMPYYTVSWGHGDPVGNSYNTYLIRDLLRGRYSYDGVICTDWGIVEDPAPEMDTFGSRCYGTEHLSVAERHLLIIMNGVDQFGGPVNAENIRAAYRLGCERYGEEVMLGRMRESAVRILTNLFRLGLFEDPFLDINESLEVVGNAEFIKAGLIAQEKSVVILKNKGGVLPLKKGIKVYVPDRKLGEKKGFMRTMEKAYTESPISQEEADGFFTIVPSPEDADAALIWAESPLTANKGYDGADLEHGGNGYFPISLQYRPYTAATARKVSIAGGDPHESFTNRSYKGKTSKAHNEADLDNILTAASQMNDRPVIVCMEMHNPAVLGEFESAADGIAVQFGVTKKAIFSVLFGDAPAEGRLPYRLPANMETVEQHCEDLFNDYEAYTDSAGNTYDYGFGLKL